MFTHSCDQSQFSTKWRTKSADVLILDCQERANSDTLSAMDEAGALGAGKEGLPNTLATLAAAAALLLEEDVDEGGGNGLGVVVDLDVGDSDPETDDEGDLVR
jgi:hypothetical protein